MTERKCIVMGCKNHFNEGGFVGDICAPCRAMLQTGNTFYTSDTFVGEMAAALRRIAVDPKNTEAAEIARGALPHPRSRAS